MVRDSLRRLKEAIKHFSVDGGQVPIFPELIWTSADGPATTELIDARGHLLRDLEKAAIQDELPEDISGERVFKERSDPYENLFVAKDHIVATVFENTFELALSLRKPDGRMDANAYI